MAMRIATEQIRILFLIDMASGTEVQHPPRKTVNDTR
jgi:hypothetical protein